MTAWDRKTTARLAVGDTLLMGSVFSGTYQAQVIGLERTLNNIRVRVMMPDGREITFPYSVRTRHYVKTA
jgi:hypothetical protein